MPTLTSTSKIIIDSAIVFVIAVVVVVVVVIVVAVAAAAAVAAVLVIVVVDIGVDIPLTLKSEIVTDNVSVFSTFEFKVDQSFHPCDHRSIHALICPS